MVSMAQPISEVGHSPPIDVRVFRFRLDRDMARRFANYFEQPFNSKPSDDVTLETFTRLTGRELPNVRNRCGDMLKPLGDRRSHVRILRGCRRRFVVRSVAAWTAAWWLASAILWRPG